MPMPHDASLNTPPARLHTDQQQLRRELRLRLRQARRELPPSLQRHAARELARRLAALPGLARARHIAAYVASDGEIDPAPFLAARRGDRAWLPVLTRQPGPGDIGMHFAAMPATGLPRHGRRPAGWQHNRYGIIEPRNRTRRAAWTLDALLMPLVGFDAAGQRLGMGGGFYDRLLADLARRPRRPWLIGLAHDIQQVDALPVAAWDRPVDVVVTGTRVLRATAR